MQGTVIIGLIQMAVGTDPDAMLKKAYDRVEQAAKAGANIICLPELFKTRYFPQHIGVDASAYAETIPGASTHIFSELAHRHTML
jgi:predicted amidohydrolase